MCEIYQRTVNSQILWFELQLKKLSKIKEQSFSGWSEPQPMFGVCKGASKAQIGVYKVIHKPTNEIMSIGQGNVSARKARHVSVFRNGGNDLISKNGTASPSATGRAMYAYDQNEDNWLFSFCACPSKEIAKSYEENLQIIHKPRFNNLGMAGCG